MSETIGKIGDPLYKGYTITIEHDIDARSPRDEYDHASKMVCWHNRYQLGDAHTWGVDSFHAFKEAHPEHLYLPIYLYEHSGVTISTSSFRDPWDSGQVGWVYMEATTLDTEFGGDRTRAEGYLKSEVEEYDTYLRGEVYGYTVQKDGEELESCWGFYGYEYCLEEAKSTVDSIDARITV